MRKNFFIFKIIYLWNSLRCNVINKNITKAFANRLYKTNLSNHANLDILFNFNEHL